jgi:hypothetical protein
MDDGKAMIELLDADGPDEERADGLMLFGRFVGSWEIEATYWDHDGNEIGERRGEWHFGWVLQGRAIQDVLISPPLEEQRRAGEPAREYGSTFRLYDPRTDTWRVSYFAPMSGVVVEMPEPSSVSNSRRHARRLGTSPAVTAIPEPDSAPIAVSAHRFDAEGNPETIFRTVASVSSAIFPAANLCMSRASSKEGLDRIAGT